MSRLKRTKIELRKIKRFFSASQERRLAKKLGKKRTPNSGAGKIKGDLRDQEYLTETKVTEKKQFILKLSMLQKTEHQAQKAGLKPEWIITFGNEDYQIRRI